MKDKLEKNISSGGTALVNKPSRVEFGCLKFLILDAPNNDNLNSYIREMAEFGVTDLVRTCELTYDEEHVHKDGIRTHEMVFPDGDAPPDVIINRWVRLVNDVCCNSRAGIAIHCVAGLGRAPLLVVVALIEKGMDPLDAIAFIRERRKGAINRRQLQYLKSYRRRIHGFKRCCNAM